jgi:hypothetical protein
VLKKPVHWLVEEKMTRNELAALAERVYDIDINSDPYRLTLAVLELRVALLKAIRHLEREGGVGGVEERGRNLFP